jgi:peptide deformylase
VIFISCVFLSGLFYIFVLNILMMIKNMLFVLLWLAGLGFISSCDKDPEIVYTGTPVDSLAFTDAEKALIFSGGTDSSMYVMNFFVYQDSLVLRSKSREVNLNDTATLFRLTRRLLTTVKDPANDGIGIAAPQVGILRKIIWVARYDKSESNPPFEVYLNPRITRYSDTSAYRTDGCLSIPGVSDNSKRAIWVNIEYDLPDGSHHTEHIIHRLTAHIFQHEIDHLSGILFIDRLY